MQNEPDLWLSRHSSVGGGGGCARYHTDGRSRTNGLSGPRLALLWCRRASLALSTDGREMLFCCLKSGLALYMEGGIRHVMGDEVTLSDMDVFVFVAGL